MGCILSTRGEAGALTWTAGGHLCVCRAQAAARRGGARGRAGAARAAARAAPAAALDARGRARGAPLGRGARQAGEGWCSFFIYARYVLG